jgi:glucose/arabinose dehydrogenase
MNVCKTAAGGVRFAKWAAALGLASLGSFTPVANAAAAPQSYVKQAATCDGFPRIAIETAPGFCIGLVMAPAQDEFHTRKIRTPRMLLQLRDAKRWLVTDLGGWTDKRGKVWLMEVDKPGWVKLKVLLGGLALPHTLALGPDRAIYVAEMNRIFRLDVEAGTATTVIDGLPGNRLHIGRHPLSHFVFDQNGDFLVNVGADTDQCANTPGSMTAGVCHEAEGDEARAVIRRYAYLGAGRWSEKATIVARGLRNSLVLVRHRSGTLIQGENSYDFAPSSDRPYDEINVIKQGANYGWPYCYDSDQPTPAWVGTKVMDCASASHTKPVAYLPPHSAPLGALYYAGAMFPALQGKLLMSWHGYRPTGSRIVAFDVDDAGVPLTVPHPRYPEYAEGGVQMMNYRDGPAAEPAVLTTGWALVPGSHPAGAPVGLTVAQDGAIWVADDRNAAILRIAVDRP